MSLYEDRVELFYKSVHFEKVDYIPFSACASAAWSKLGGMVLRDYLQDYEKALDVNIRCSKEFGADSVQGVLECPFLSANNWLSNIAMPGDPGVGEDDLWQIKEKELVRFDDYKFLEEQGFDAFESEILSRMDQDQVSPIAEFSKHIHTAEQQFVENGIPNIRSFIMVIPFELLCGGRSLEAFFMDDLFDEPDYIEKIMDIIQEAQLKRYRKMMEEQKPIAVWIGGWRSTPEMVSPAIFDRFVWPYLKDFANLCLEMSVVPMFHLDANWDSQLKRFLEIPEKSSVMCLDSKTNIRLAREVLGDHMCILGDVPANMQAFKKYEDVYAYVTAVIDDIGPYGYIAASGCDIPINAKRECVKAISDAAHQYKIR